MWAIKAKDRDLYYAATQYGPPGALTVSSLAGNPPIYEPRKFEVQEIAETLRDKLKTSEPGYEWEVVKI